MISALSGGLATIAGAIVIGLALPAFSRYRRQPYYTAGEDRSAGEDHPAGENHPAREDHPAREGQAAAVGAGLS